MTKQKLSYILGLDIGANSIGWAVVDCEKEEGEHHQGIYAGYKPTRLRALNSRIFEDMLDAKTKVPKNQKRRSARGARNRRSYYKKRRKELIKTLKAAGFLPKSYKRQTSESILNEIDRTFAERKLGKPWSKDWTAADKTYRSAYAMRNFALEEKLEPFELGRLLLQLQRRRGYFSNRGAKYIELIRHLSLEALEDDEKSMSAEEKKESGPVLAAISELDKQLDGRTLGQFIWQEAKEKQIPPQRITLFEFEKTQIRKEEKIIESLQFRAQREMYEQEFDAILNKQNSFHDMDNETIKAIKKAIFHQRPLQLQKGKVGNCNIYPRKKRAALMRLEMQECRIWQMINNIKIGKQPLSEEQRQTLFTLANDPDKLNKSGRIAWKEITKALGVKQHNYSRGDDGEGKTGLIGNRTAQAISACIGKDQWRALSPKDKIALVEDLLSIHNKRALYKRLVGYWGFARYESGDDPAKGALGLVMNEQLEDGYGKHSLKAINALLEHLREGKDYYAAVKEIGALESIAKPIREVAEDYVLSVDSVPEIANPTVQKALYEIRRVVNAIVKLYGKPAIIRLEMARDMKSSKKHRREIESQQKQNRKNNEEAEKEILKHFKSKDSNITLEILRNKAASRVQIEDRNKYKMWREQGCRCPYCGEGISIGDLFSGEAEIEHILPYTGFRQSYMNTVVSCRNCNQTKAKRTPYEAWGHTERWSHIEKFAKAKYAKNKGLYPKQRNILKKEHNPEDEEAFVERQLNDTRYIATASKKMLDNYGVPVDVNNGMATGELRRLFGLNTVLPREPDTGAYEKTDEKIDTETGEILQYSAKKVEKIKSRQDHRHHAVDAFVIAMTDRAMLKAMIEVHKQQQDTDPSHKETKEDWIKRKRLVLPENWQDDDNLHDLLKSRLDDTVVSHMTKRKVWGALHEETLYRKSHFKQSLKLDTKSGTLKKVQKIAQVEAGGNTPWIANEPLRANLLEWATNMQELTLAKRSLPNWNGNKLYEFAYQTPCVSNRKSLVDWANGLSKLNADWQPGTGTWIAEKSIHDVLFRWLKKHNLLGKEANAIKKKLDSDPPYIRNKKGHSIIIKRVSLADRLTDSYVKMGNSYVTPGSNHHFVLFHNGKEGEEKQRRIRMETMLDTAKRASAGQPIVVKEPSSEWEGEWHYELHLCVNDIVRCEDMSIFDDNEKFAPEHKKTPYFRVQTMNSESDKKIDLRLRHHSISGTDSNWGLWRIQSLNNIELTKVQLGNLGLLPDGLIHE